MNRVALSKLGRIFPPVAQSDFFIDVLAEIVTKFSEVDAFSFDGLHYGGVCYCRHCRDTGFSAIDAG